MKVYHYTTEEGVSGIVTSSTFYPSYLDAQLDTAYGEGWYFTTMAPHTPNEHLEQSLWQRRVPEKTKRYVAFEIDDSLLEYCRPGVYRLKIDVVQEGVIKLNTTYTYNSTGGFAFKFLEWGYKNYVPVPQKTSNDGLKIFGALALLFLGIAAIGAISKSS